MALFDPKHKTKLHVVVLIIVVAVMAASGVRILMAEMPMTRADTMALGAVRHARTCFYGSPLID